MRPTRRNSPGTPDAGSHTAAAAQAIAGAEGPEEFTEDGVKRTDAGSADERRHPGDQGNQANEVRELVRADKDHRAIHLAPPTGCMSSIRHGVQNEAVVKDSPQHRHRRRR